MRRHVRYELHPVWTVLGVMHILCYVVPPIALGLGTGVLVVQEIYPLLNVQPTFISIAVGLYLCLGVAPVGYVAAAGAVVTRWVYPLFNIQPTIATVGLGAIGLLGLAVAGTQLWSRINYWITCMCVLFE